MTHRRVIVAGVGNVFLGDDGFGVEVAHRLASRPLPGGVEVLDVGIRGVHLAYELLDGCDLLVIVDAAPTGRPPGALSVLEVHPRSDGAVTPPPVVDGHGLAPHEVLALLGRLGGSVGRVLVVACEPADTEEGMGLSAAVLHAVDEAVSLVDGLVREQPDGEHTVAITKKGAP